MSVTTGRVAFYLVIGVGFGAVLFFGAAIWGGWMDGELATLLSSITVAVMLVLRWTLLAPHAPRWLGGRDDSCR